MRFQFSVLYQKCVTKSGDLNTDDTEKVLCIKAMRKLCLLGKQLRESESRAKVFRAITTPDTPRDTKQPIRNKRDELTKYRTPNTIHDKENVTLQNINTVFVV